MHARITSTPLNPRHQVVMGSRVPGDIVSLVCWTSNGILAPYCRWASYIRGLQWSKGTGHQVRLH